MSARHQDLAGLLREVAAAAGVPVQAVVSDGQRSIRKAVAMAVFRLRKRFQAMVREEVAQGLNDPSQVDEELKHLAEAL